MNQPLICTALMLVFAGCEATIGDVRGRPAPGSTPSEETPQLPVPPELVNLVDKYFPLTETGSAPKRIFRLTRRQLDNTASVLFPGYTGTTATALVPRDPLQTNYEYATYLAFNGANFTPYTTWAGQISSSARANPRSVLDCAPADAACLEAKARVFLGRAFRQTATPEVVNTFVSFFQSSVAEVGVPDATADLVDVTLSSPAFVFRDEVRTDGKGTLPAPAQLQNLTYTLADVPPEALGLAPTDGLSQDELVRRVMATPQARLKLARFFSTWLEVKEPSAFTLAPTSYPDFTPAVAAAAVQETEAFLNYQLAKAAPTMRDVTQSTQSFVTSELASIYEVSQASATGTLVNLDPAKRLGIFTLAGVLASHSGPTTTRLVKRGVFFVRKVMCLELGAPPPGVTTGLLLAGDTERQRIESATNAQARCQGCHSYINPFGFLLENYDATGKWRTTDEGHPIDASIDVGFLDEGPLKTNSPTAGLTRFTDSMRFKQCFVRQLFRYYLGRDEQPSDTPLLRDMFVGFATGDAQSIVAPLQLLGTSGRMTQRLEAP